MTIVPTVLFLLAAIAATATIWTSVKSALPAIRSLRLQLADALEDRTIHVATRNTRTAIEAESRRAARRRRRAHPKPVTHRLHHFPHRAHAA
jgi:hypothetical protein